MSCSSSRHFVDCSGKTLTSTEFYDTLFSICEEWTTRGIIFSSYKGLNCVNWVKPKISNKDESELVLGPFQGKAAVTRIDFNSGVCGAALVKDVHSFPNHIACDSISNSEIVIPIRKTDIVAVLDMDSPIINFFTEEDQEGLERICQLLENNINWMSLRSENNIISF